MTIAEPLKWALATRHPWLSPRLSTPGSPIQDRGDHNTRYVVTSHIGEMMSITVYSQAGIENCHRRNCNPSLRERWLEKLSGLLGFVKFCRFCSCFPETDDECGKLKLMKGLSTCWQLCSHLAPRRNRFRRQTLCENQGKVRRQKKEPILWQISTFWWIRPGGDFQGEDLKLETSDKWRLAKRELICFLPDSLDNDIGINYEDEDGVESPGKLNQ